MRGHELLQIVAIIFLVALTLFTLMNQRARSNLTGDQLRLVEETSRFSLMEFVYIVLVGAIGFVLLKVFPLLQMWVAIFTAVGAFGVIVIFHFRKEKKQLLKGVPENYIRSIRMASVVLWSGTAAVIGLSFLWNLRII